MSLNKRGHGMSLPLWAYYLLWIWIMVADPFFEIAKVTNFTIATIIYFILIVLQAALVYKFGWKALIPLLTYIIWGLTRV